MTSHAGDLESHDVTMRVTSSYGDVIDELRHRDMNQTTHRKNTVSDDKVPGDSVDEDNAADDDDDDDDDDNMDSPTEQRLMRHLLRLYERSVRPVRNASDTVMVRMGLTLTQIFNMVSIHLRHRHSTVNLPTVKCLINLKLECLSFFMIVNFVRKCYYIFTHSSSAGITFIQVANRAKDSPAGATPVFDLGGIYNMRTSILYKYFKFGAVWFINEKGIGKKP